MNIDIIVLGAIAVFVLLRLYGVLGQQIGHEKPPMGADASFDKDSKVIELAPKLLEKAVTSEEEQYKDLAEEVRTGLIDIRTQDKAFRLKDFVEGAKSAFEMVMQAMNKDDKDVLQMLLSAELFAACAAEIKGRFDAEEYQDNTLVAILGAEVTAAYKKDNHAVITVQFVSEQVQVMRDKKGDKLVGFEPEIENVEDSWTFKRDLRGNNPNWTIIAT